MGNVPCYLKFWGQADSVASKCFKNGNFQSIFARSGLALRSSEKYSIISNRKSPTSFPMSLRWTAYVAPSPQMEPQRRQFFRFPYKNGLCSKKVCYKVSLCDNFQRQSCKAFIGLSVRAQIVGGGCTLVSEILNQSDPPPSKMALSSLYSLVAPQA